MTELVDVLAGQQLTARCAFCPTWSLDGPATATLEAARAHRAEAHPEIVPAPRPRRGYRQRRPVDDPAQRRRDSERRRVENQRALCGTATGFSLGCTCSACKTAWKAYGKPT